MHSPTPILKQLDLFMKQNHINLSTLARLTEVNAGTLSAILNKNKVLTVDQLDRLTSFMQLPEGYFYEQYIQEYLSQSLPHWRRFRPFLYRCAELDKLECVTRVIDLLMEDLMYAPLLFDAAEELFHKDKRAAAALIFESVANSEKHQHSERLAFCQYRLFLIRLGTDQEKNYQAALHFEPYIERLDELDQLDALKELLNAYRSLRRWDKLYDISKKLNELAKIQYSLAHSPKKEKQKFRKKTTRPLFFYVAFSNLQIGSVHYEQEEYETALQIAYRAADLSWVRETDEEALYWKSLFEEWTQANIYLTRLMAGDLEMLPEYVNFIASREKELPTGLRNIMIAANRHNINVDHLLDQFKAEISGLLEQEGNDLYSQHYTDNQVVGLLCELTDYYLSKGEYDIAFQYLSQWMNKSEEIKDDRSIVHYKRLYEHLRKLAEAKTKI